MKVNDNAAKALLYSAARTTLQRQLGKVKRPAMRLLPLLLVVSSCAPPLVRPAPFRARPDSIERGDLRGPFSGRVLDADTDRSVAGALVYASWRFVDGSGQSAPAGYREHVGSTDATGHYLVPRLEDLPGARLSDFHLVIYKRGFVAYRSDRRFDDFGPRTDFTQNGYNVELQRWRPELSHARHLRYIGGGPALSQLTSWEVADAVAELAGQRHEAPVAAAPASAPVANLDASGLLKPADMKTLTGYDGSFDVSELGDEPRSPSYDTVHLQARGKDESYDVALRVWRLPPDKAAKRYDALADELPGAATKNEIGDKSLRAATPGGDILGLAFLDARHGLVILIQCGASQCRTHETVLALARTIKERAETQLAGGAP
jgi:hypothetical protein